jgi:hypothetical protein
MEVLMLGSAPNRDYMKTLTLDPMWHVALIQVSVSYIIS